MIDEALFARQVERQRRQKLRDAALLFGLVAVVCYVIAFALMKVWGMHPGSRGGVALVLAPLMAAGFAVVLWVVLTSTGRVTDAVLHPGGTGKGPAPTSQAEAFFRAGEVAESMRTFDELRARHGDTVAILRVEADLHLGRGGDPARARDLLVRLRQAAECTAADELYATQRLIDLNFGVLRDEGRALVEMRRLVDRFPGTRDAEGARAELERRKAGPNR
jgi:hypothetical protein